VKTLTPPLDLSAEAAAIPARRPDSIQPTYPDGRTALISIARAYRHTPQHTRGVPTTGREAMQDELVTAVTGRYIALHGLLFIAATTHPETVEDLLTAIDRAQSLADGEDYASAHAVCCNGECGCTRPASTGQPPGDLCDDCLAGLVADRDEKVELMVEFLADMFTPGVLTMAIVL
jgi:hypothetical protein